MQPSRHLADFFATSLMFFYGFSDSTVGFCSALERVLSAEGNAPVDGLTIFLKLGTLRRLCFGLILLNCLLFIPSMFIVHTITAKMLSLLISFFGGFQCLVTAGRIFSFVLEGLIFSLFYIVTTFINCRSTNQIYSVTKSYKSRPRSEQSGVDIFTDNIRCFFVQTFFILQIEAVALIPYFPFRILSILQLSLLYSFYFFDYRWTDCQLSLKRRAYILELYWPYYCGFGLPLALTQFLPLYFLRMGVFYALFHFFVMSANTAENYPHRNLFGRRRAKIMFVPFKLTNLMLRIVNYFCKRFKH